MLLPSCSPVSQPMILHKLASCPESLHKHGMDVTLRMCLQTCGFTFSLYTLIPMGSYPQIADKRGNHDLYGPVNRLMCAAYDRAMVMFLTCVKVSVLKVLVHSLQACCLSCRVPAVWDNRSYKFWCHPFSGYLDVVELVVLRHVGRLLEPHWCAHAGILRLDHLAG